ncbi:MAG: DUF1844 domain-containing protein [Ignavibacteria bacterium]|nr:DUF1844 domain-containing protein [Ignavibacteria bacterium]
MEDDKTTQMFFSLIYSFQMQTWMSLGKIKSPVSDKLEKDLNAAQTTIDVLDMIHAKTKGNLNEDETKFLEHVIAELKLNYVEETKKEENPEPKIEEKNEPNVDKQ